MNLLHINAPKKCDQPTDNELRSRLAGIRDFFKRPPRATRSLSNYLTLDRQGKRVPKKTGKNAASMAKNACKTPGTAVSLYAAYLPVASMREPAIRIRRVFWFHSKASTDEEKKRPVRSSRSQNRGGNWAEPKTRPVPVSSL